MIWWLSALGWLRKAARAALDLARRYPLQAALILAVAACGWLWHGKGKALAERDAARAEVAAMVEANNVATERAKEARAATEKLSKELADATDQHAADLDAISRRALADRMRAKAPRCDASGAIAATVPDNPANDPGANSGGVYFTATEADNLRRHEVRSTTCEGWARGLIAEGLAVGE